jgi:hypothetical protein
VCGGQTWPLKRTLLSGVRALRVGLVDALTPAYTIEKEGSE